MVRVLRAKPFDILTLLPLVLLVSACDRAPSVIENDLDAEIVFTAKGGKYCENIEVGVRSKTKLILECKLSGLRDVVLKRAGQGLCIVAEENFRSKIVKVRSSVWEREPDMDTLRLSELACDVGGGLK